MYEQKIIQLTDIPELETKLLLGQDTVSVISTFFTPALDSKSKQAARIQFENMSEYIANSKHLQIVMGEFNQMSLRYSIKHLMILLFLSYTNHEVETKFLS
ncbi:MAG: hypothetical protein IPJ39_12555 [Saprospiraceae bacterium]|nr:hypothetical protein [Saprospiraceae bacterium]